MTHLKTTIETKLKKSVILTPATDCVNLLFEATIDGLVVARVYKSFDKNYNEIKQIRYVNAD